MATSKQVSDFKKNFYKTMDEFIKTSNFDLHEKRIILKDYLDHVENIIEKQQGSVN